MPSAETAPSVNAPVHSIRKHSLKVSIWRNETQSGVIYNSTLIRTYKDGDDFRDTASLGFHDLANAAKLLRDAETWIAGQIVRDRTPASATVSAAPQAPSGRKASRSA